MSQRSDAARNRELIVTAARQLFAEEGFEVSMDAVARKAGVGRATLYRNFEDKHALSWAICDVNVRSLEEVAKLAGEKPDAFVRLLTAAVEESLDCHALIPALLARRASPHLENLARRVTKLLSSALKEGQRRGELRADLRPSDLLEILGMVFSSAVTANYRDRRRGVRRALELVLDGVRPR